MRFALFGATGATGSAFLRQEYVRRLNAQLKHNLNTYDLWTTDCGDAPLVHNQPTKSPS